MTSTAATPEEYLASLPEDRRAALSTVRDVIRTHLPEGYEEGMQYGMISYFVPHSLYPAGYHCDPKQPLPFASLASQKNHMAIYLMGLFGDESAKAQFRQAWEEAGKKLDMGKSCIRFKRAEDLALEVLGAAIARMPVADHVARYEALLLEPRRRRG